MTKLEKITLTLFKYLLIWEIGGLVYYLIEIIARGRSHVSMYILGGICLVIIGLLNEVFTYNMYIELQILIGDVVVVLLEFITGLIVNVWLKLDVWDYTDVPFNIMGQICLPFALIWLPIIFVAILLDDFIRFKVFGEQQPNYRSWIVEKIQKRKAAGK